MSGKVVQVNEALASDPALLTRSPYGKGWVCVLQPKDLAAELGTLRIGSPVVAWYQAEIERLRKARAAAGSAGAGGVGGLRAGVPASGRGDPLRRGAQRAKRATASRTTPDT